MKVVEKMHWKTIAGKKKRWKEGNGEAASYTPRDTNDTKQKCVLLRDTRILLCVSSMYWTNSFISQLGYKAGSDSLTDFYQYSLLVFV